MKIKSFIAILLLASTAAAFSQKNSYVGYRHKGVINGQNLPNGVKSLGGGLTSNENYGVSRYAKGKRYMLWLEEVVSRDAKGVPTWIVKNVLTFDNLKKNRNFSFPTLRPACKTAKTISIWWSKPNFSRKRKHTKFSMRGVPIRKP
jgi:hypothetical protein